jgi:hypothetical protein
MAKEILEKKIQERFFSSLINQKDGFENTAIKTYQNLVFLRYLEVLKNNFPLLVEQIDETLFEESIKAFMKHTPTTPFVWQIPNDYRKFVKKQKFFGKSSYIYELLYFDWIEIEIYMKEYKLKENKNFSYKENYELSKSARVKRFKYDIINHDFTSKRENFLVIYYNFETNDVIYREINQLIYELLKRVNKKQSLEKVLKQLCLENEIDFKEAKKVLKDPLKELLKNKVLI